MNREARLVLTILTVWFFLACVVGLTGLFKSVSPPVVAITVWTLTIITLTVSWKVPQVNRWVRSVNVSQLIALHLARFVGFYFLVLCQRGELSCVFARPAGIGDIATAIGATILLLYRAASQSSPGWHKAILIWNCFGLLDIVFVVFSALRVGLVDPTGMAPLRSLPLMLLPTFLVPLIIVSHILIFVRLRKGILQQ